MNILSKKHYTIIFFCIVFVLTVSAACRFDLGGNEVLEVPTPVPTEELEQTYQTWSDIAQNAQPNETVTFTITQDQLTAAIALQLQQETDPILRNPQAVLQNGQIEIYGDASQGVLEGTLHLVLSASVDENGEPVLSITSAEIGDIPVPDSLLDTLSSVIDDSLTSSLGSTLTGFRLQSITVQDGQLSVTGNLR